MFGEGIKGTPSPRETSGAPSLRQTISLLHVNYLAARIQCSVHANFLAFELLHPILVIDVVRGAVVRLQHVLITLLHDGPGEDLCGRSIRRRLRIRCAAAGRLLPGLIWSLPREGAKETRTETPASRICSPDHFG